MLFDFYFQHTKSFVMEVDIIHFKMGHLFMFKNKRRNNNTNSIG